MAELDDGSKALISGIEKDAKQEAEKIIREAEKRAKELTAHTEKQVRSIRKEADEKAKAQSEAATKKVLSGVDIEIKRKTLHMREKIFSEILGRVKEEFVKRIQKPGYKDILLDWVVEAAVGLGAEEAEVSVSKEGKGLVDAQFLKKAEKRAEKISGKKVRLKLSDDSPQSRQGVVLTAADGRTAFNNQVSTRLLRKQREIRDMIYKELFGD
jgi:vacuolar-type H+-ATPase subunit E/Vma4